MRPSEKSQLDKLKEAVRQPEANDNEARFDKRIEELVKQKPKGSFEGDHDD